MDTTECLEDEQTCVVDEIIQTGRQEEIVTEDCLAFCKLRLRTIEIEVDVETFEEFSDGVLVRVRLLLDDAN